MKKERQRGVVGQAHQKEGEKKRGQKGKEQEGQHDRQGTKKERGRGGQAI